jgi:hypothetical protein
MADNVQPDAGEEHEAASSGLILSVDPLQDVVAYKLAADDDSAVDDSDGDTGDSDGSDADSSDDGDDSGETLVVVDGANDSGDSDENSDADATDDSDGDASVDD